MYQQHLIRQQERAFGIFKTIAPKVDLKRIAHDSKPLKRILRKVSPETLRIDTEKLLRQSFVEVRALVKDATQDEPLHEARKIIKSIYYILHLVFTPSTPLQYQDLKTLEETIGDWHDLAVLLENMEAFEDNQTNATQIFLQRLRTEKETLQQKIPNLVQKELRCWKIFGKIMP